LWVKCYKLEDADVAYYADSLGDLNFLYHLLGMELVNHNLNKFWQWSLTR